MVKEGRVWIRPQEGADNNTRSMCAGGWGTVWASVLPSPWLSRNGRGDGQGLLFGVDDVHEFGLQGSTTHKEAIHIGLACQLLAGCPSHGTSINDAGALSHCI